VNFGPPAARLRALRFGHTIHRVCNAESITQPYPEERLRHIWSTHRFDTRDLLDSE
jgi:hypothetical protein